jgi:hypothetical protein
MSIFPQTNSARSNLSCNLHSVSRTCAQRGSSLGQWRHHYRLCGLLACKDKQNFERDKAAIAPNCMLGAGDLGQRKKTLKILPN